MSDIEIPFFYYVVLPAEMIHRYIVGYCPTGFIKYFSTLHI
jgi:hypothetical protein